MGKRSLLVLGALLTALTACSSGGGRPATSPVTSPVTSAPPTLTTSGPAPAPPPLPDAARQPTRAGAEAFFRYFMTVYAYTFVSQDTSVIRSISDSTCKFCSGAQQRTQQAHSAGHRVVGGDVHVTNVSAAPGVPTDGLLVNALFDQGAAKVLDRDGNVLQQSPSNDDVRVDAAERWLGSAWQMRAVEVYPRRSS